MNHKEKKIDTSVWNTDNVTEFKDLAEKGQSFTGDLSNWDLSNLKKNYESK